MTAGMSRVFVFIMILMIPSQIVLARDRDEVFQISTINALLNGVLEGETDYKAVEARGDFGIGTFNDLDGEMLALDGIYYQIKSDGHAYLVEPSIKTPFVTVTHFDVDRAFEVSEPMGYRSFLDFIDSRLPTQNIIYAVRVEGKFKYLKARSVPVQKKPYPKLEQVVKDQPIFEFREIEGALVGFRFPEYFQGLNVPAYHFHFLTQDRQAGGHVLDLEISSGTVSVDDCGELDLNLLQSDAFYQADLSKVDKTALIKVEK